MDILQYGGGIVTGKQRLEQQQVEDEMSYNGKIVVIGLVGGLFWSFIGYVAYYFHFIKFGPSLVLTPWAFGDWKNGPIGQWVGILVIGLLSILVAFIYKIILQKVYNIWAPMLFGVSLWAIVFYLLNPIFPNLKSVAEFDVNTIITSICLYILYGLFIGYSISYEYKQAHMDQ